MSEKRVLVDQVMREFLLEKLTDKPDTWTSFLDLSIAMARLQICSPTSAIALLTDLVEVSSLDDYNVTKYKAGDGTDDPDDKIEIAEDQDDKLFEGMDISVPGLDKIVSLTQEEKKKKIKVDYNFTELTRLWNICPDNHEACRMKSSDFMPQLDVFFSEAFKEMEVEPTSLSGILGDPMFGWKTLRLLARRSPYFFQMFGGAPISPLQNYLEYVLKKINTDRDPHPNSQEDSQMANRKLNETKAKGSDTQANDAENMKSHFKDE
ncbi:unnamed protein product [Orchesella dallaii]|uniref:Uncharacterized protein n=1 Tax=Orchesella dallaii TaxID=48710 RepID=A0ABP1QTQ1_9HEXA